MKGSGDESLVLAAEVTARGCCGVLEFLAAPQALIEVRLTPSPDPSGQNHD